MQTPLLALAVAFAVAYAVPIVRARRETLGAHRLHGRRVGGVGRLRRRLPRTAGARAGQQWLFVRSHPLDLVAVVLPLVQPLRLLRVVSTLLLVGRRARMAPQITLTTYVGGRGGGADDVRLAGRAAMWSGTRRTGTSRRWATRCGGRSRR